MLGLILSLVLELPGAAGPAIAPASAVVQACETFKPRADGIKVTVCDGRVTQYEDAAGNVSRR